MLSSERIGPDAHSIPGESRRAGTQVEGYNLQSRVRGRIWRIVPEGHENAADRKPNLSRASNADLVKALVSVESLGPAVVIPPWPPRTSLHRTSLPCRPTRFRPRTTASAVISSRTP